MFCSKCGAALSDHARFCSVCGTPGSCAPSPSYISGGSIGFSPRINDPAFARYISHSKQWALIFSIIIALIAVAGFYIYGENNSEMGNPQALFIGIGLGAMFIVIALVQNLKKSAGSTWDGSVVDKKIERKRRRVSGDDDDSTEWVSYDLYTVVIRSNSGKLHNLSSENSPTLYHYYQIGDRVRHHKGLNTYEKYDKSRDSMIFCNACSTMNDIQSDFCKRCKCPLLK